MHLAKLSISKLYGTLDKEVTFNKNLNLLVGINGSGKTSVLNVIDWLLSPNLPKLCTVPFEKMSLHFSFNKRNYVLDATQKNLKLSLNLKCGKETFEPITVNLVMDPKKTDLTDHEELEERYGRLGPEESEIPMWNLLAMLPKPIVISLDRSISAEAENEVYMDVDYRPNKVRRNLKHQSPLEKVKEATSLSYNKYRFEVSALNERLKAQLVMSALKIPEFEWPAKNNNRVGIKSAKDIDLLEKKVIAYLSTSIKDIDVIQPIKLFFERIKKLSNFPSKLPKSEQFMFSSFFYNRYMQVEEMAKAFNEFELKSASAYEKLKKYLDTVNLFFADSKKQIAFSELKNVLCFHFIRTDGTRADEERAIGNLSSGEKQILILFTFLAFVAEKNRVVIVDEPELSLHPKWQAEFTEAFLKLKPDSTQLLMATHSPEIVGQFKNDCVVLLP